MSTSRDETPDDRRRRLLLEAEDAPRLSGDAFVRQGRRAFVTGGLTAIGGLLGWRYLATGPQDDRIPALLRDGHRFNERLWRDLHNPDARAREFSRSAATGLRVNGMYGLHPPLDADAWRLHVRDPSGRVLHELTLADVQALPRADMVTEFKCIEGWSEIAHWTGVRFSDFADRFAPSLTGRPYVGLATPDGAYTVGLERAMTRHPQTLLAYALDGVPLTAPHGAPLRLVTTLRYGVKMLKRIGTVQFMDERPTDFWAERGYDWYLGH